MGPEKPALSWAREARARLDRESLRFWRTTSLRSSAPSSPRVSALCSQSALGMERKTCVRFHVRLNMCARPIANKCHEGNLRRTFKRGLKVCEIVGKEANATSPALAILLHICRFCKVSCIKMHHCGVCCLACHLVLGICKLRKAWHVVSLANKYQCFLVVKQLGSWQVTLLQQPSWLFSCSGCGTS